MLILAWVGCKRESGTYPRATVYPRVEIYDSSYSLLDGFPIDYYVNASTVRIPVADAEKGWADVRYPAYGGTLHITSVAVSPEAEEAEVRSRIERMVMNVGSERVVEEEFLSADSLYKVLLFHEPGFTPTPVQFVALGAGRITGGVFSFDRTDVAVDSVAPMVDAVVRDIKFTFGRR